MSASPEKIQAFSNALKGWFEEKDNKVNDLSVDFTNDTNSYPTAQAVIEAIADTTDLIPHTTEDLTNNSGFITIDDIEDAIEGKVDSTDLATVATTGSYTDLTNKPVLTVEKQVTPENTYAATYVFKQDGTQVGTKINIPKDLLIKSASAKTVGATPTSIEQGYNLTEGDQYLEFIANTVDNDNAQTPLIIPLEGLFEIQVADETTLTLSNGVFSVKSGSIGATQLTQAVNTSLGYANEWESSPAHGITSQNITNWNAKPTTQDVEDTIDDELDDLLDALTASFNE